MPVATTGTVGDQVVAKGQVVRHVYLGNYSEWDVAGFTPTTWMIDPVTGEFSAQTTGTILLTATAVSNLPNLFFYVFAPETSSGVEAFALQWIPYFSVSADPTTGVAEWFPLTSPQILQLGVPNYFTINCPAAAIAIAITAMEEFSIVDPPLSVFSNIRAILGASA